MICSRYKYQHRKISEEEEEVNSHSNKKTNRETIKESLTQEEEEDGVQNQGRNAWEKVKEENQERVKTTTNGWTRNVSSEFDSENLVREDCKLKEFC